MNNYERLTPAPDGLMEKTMEPRQTLEHVLDESIETFAAICIKMDFIRKKLIGRSEPMNRGNMPELVTVKDRAGFLNDQLGALYRDLEDMADFIATPEEMEGR